MKTRARAWRRSCASGRSLGVVRLIAETKTTVMRPAHTDSSKTPASGASIWNMSRVSTALAAARPMAPRSSVGVRTDHRAEMTNRPSRR